MNKSRSKKRKIKSPLLKILVVIFCFIICSIMIIGIKNKTYKNEKSLERNVSDKAISRDTLVIKVINCTKIKGLAATTKEELNHKGYTKIDVANGKEREDTEILVRDEMAKAFIKSDTGINNVKNGVPKKLDENEDYDILIFLGKDYKKIGEIK